MKAAVFHGAGDVRIEERPRPEGAVGEVVLRVLRSGICGSDATEWRSGPHLFPGVDPHPVTGESGPFVFGHEFIGEVVEAVPGGRFAVGDVVASGAGLSCGRCRRCSEGRTNLCERYSTYGLNRPGGLAELVAVAESTVEPVPAGLELDAAALAQPLAVGFHAARRAGVEPGDSVVMIGAGAIGTFVLMALRDMHPDMTITVLDVDEDNLHRAGRLGASAALFIDRTSSEPPAGLVATADVVIEASGAPGRLATAVAIAVPGGRVLQVGLPAGPQEIAMHPLVLREVSIRTTLAHVCSEDLPAALALLASTVAWSELVDGVHPLDQVAGQLDRVSRGGVHGKVLFAPNGL